MKPPALLYSLAEHSDFLFFSYDLRAGWFTYVNPVCSTFFGLNTDKPKPDDLWPAVHPDDQDYFTSKLATLLDGKLNESVECRFVRGSHQRILRIHAYVIKENGGQVIVGHAEDITIYKANNDILNRHSNKKNTILNILTHDLAGPIGAIGNFTDLLKRELPAGQNVRAESYIASIKRISKNCIHLIQDFLKQEFLESAGVRLLKRRVELVSRIKTVMEEYIEMQKDLKIEFLFDVNRDAIYAEIDEDKFLQVINNLLSNALKFTPDGGSITIRIEEREKNIQLSVSDTGVGIPEKYHATLFEKFSEARRNGIRGENSTGLGMSIIKTIVEWHGGNIWFESEQDKGTTFYITLPK